MPGVSAGANGVRRYRLWRKFGSRPEPGRILGYPTATWARDASARQHDTIGAVGLDLPAAKLLLVEACVQATTCEQFTVSAPFNNTSLLYNEDHVGCTNGRQAVGNYQRGSTLHQRIQRPLDDPLALGVKRRGGFI